MSTVKKMLLIFGVLYSNLLFASSIYETETHIPIKWKTLPIRLCINESVPLKYRTQIFAAIDFWNNATHLTLFKSDCISKLKISELENIHDHSFFWVKSKFEKFTEKTSLARAIYSFNQDTGEMVDGDVLINAQYFNWDKINAELTTVLIHELGHILSLKHDFIDRDSAMNYFPYLSGYVTKKIGQYELSTVLKEYGKTEAIKFSSYRNEYFQNDFEKAILELLKEPDSSDKFYSLGMLYKQLKKYKEASEWLQKYNGIEKNDEIGIYQLGDIFWNLDKTKEAQELFELCLKINPKNYEAAANLGSIWIKNGDKVKAQSYFKEAIKNNPSHYVACMYLFELTGKKEFHECQLKFQP